MYFYGVMACESQLRNQYVVNYTYVSVTQLRETPGIFPQPPTPARRPAPTI